MKTLILGLLLLVMAQPGVAQGSWTQKGDMPEIRYGHSVNELNGKMYVVGGANTETSVYPRTALVFDTLSGPWTQIPLLDKKIRFAHCSCVLGGRLYVVGGFDSSRTLATMDMFDPSLGQWVSKPPMPTHRSLTAGVSLEGKIYVIGGIQSVGSTFSYGGTRTVEVYDTSSGTWAQLADMPSPRWGHSAVTWKGKIYVLGGVSFDHENTPHYSGVAVYDPGTNTWTTKSSLPTRRYCLTACILDSIIYVIGGWAHSGTGPIYDRVEVYNPESDTWYPETPMPVARAAPSIVLNDKIYLYGGTRTVHPCIGTSAIYEFQKKANLPGVVSLLSPAQLAIVSADSALFTWRSTSPASTRYKLEISADSAFGDSTVIFDQLTDTAKVMKPLVSNLTYFWRVSGYNTGGWGPYSEVRRFSVVTTSVESERGIPTDVRLDQNYPNPFNANSKIRYQISERRDVRLVVCDLLGREVAVLVHERKAPGSYETHFDGAGLSSGVYIYRLTAGDYTESRKMLLTR